MTNIKGAIKHKTSVPDSRKFGIDVINESFHDTEVKSALKSFCVIVVKQDEVKSVAGELVKEIIADKGFQSDAGTLAGNGFTSKPIIAHMENLCGLGSIDMATRPEFTQHLNDLMARSMFKEEIYSELIKTMVIDNIVSRRWLVGQDAMLRREQIEDI